MLRLIVGVRRRPDETWVEYTKSNLAQRRARCEVQTDGLVRSPAQTQTADDAESADYAVAPMAGPNSGMDTMVSHKYYEK